MARAGIGVAMALSSHVAESIKSGQLIPLLHDFHPLVTSGQRARSKIPQRKRNM